MQKPCPSSVFQNQVKELLDHDEPKAVGFLNSILNQLNWAFSEFIGMLQEIQQIAGRSVLIRDAEAVNVSAAVSASKKIERK